MDLQSFQVYIGNLDESTTERQLFDCLSALSKSLQNVHVVRNVSGKCQGYGFAKFSKDEDAYRVVARVNSLVIPIEVVLHGRRLTIHETYRLSKSEIERGLDGKGRTIFIGNLNVLMKDDELKNAFVKFGPVVGSHIVVGKGIGFITFSDNTAALAALSSMQNEELLHQRIYCFWARSDQQLHEEKRLGFMGDDSAGLVESSDHLIPRELGSIASHLKHSLDTAKCLKEALDSLPDIARDTNEQLRFPTLRNRNDAFAESRVKELFSESWCT